VSAKIYQFPYGGRDGRSVLDPLPPLPRKPVRVQVRERWDERRFGGFLPLQANDGVVIYTRLRSANAGDREEGAELLACVRALQHVQGHPQAELAGQVLAQLRGLYAARGAA